jgi:hypothetical protein
MSNSSKEPLIEKQLDALARGQLAAAMLRLDTLRAAAEAGFCSDALPAVRARPS